LQAAGNTTGIVAQQIMPRASKQCVLLKYMSNPMTWVIKGKEEQKQQEIHNRAGH